MGGSTVGQGARALPPRFLEADVKSLIVTIGAPPRFITFAYCAPPDFNCAPPQILMSTPAYASQ